MVGEADVGYRTAGLEDIQPELRVGSSVCTLYSEERT